MIKFLCTNPISRFFQWIFSFFETALAPLWDLGIRLWVAKIFWDSGLVKISSWDDTLYLFQNQYKTPFFSPEIAANLATAIELSCPIFLVLGLAARLAAVPLLIMSLFIQFTYSEMTTHVYWMILLSSIILRGPGSISLDYFIRKCCWK